MTKGRLLVVTEDRDISKMLRIYFEASGYNLFTATHADEALTLCRTRRPQALIIDARLPTAAQLLAALQADSWTRHTPIINLTPNYLPPPVLADDFVSIPFDIEELKLQLETSIRRALQAGHYHPVTNLPGPQRIEGRDVKINITVKTRRTHDLSEAERAAIISLCTEAHRADFSLLFSFLPPHGLHVLAYDEQRLVSHAVVTTRWLQPDNLPLLKTAYVDAVATHPLYQRQGIGSAVMRHLASLISDYEIACLETERLSFYAQLGWEAWRGPLAGRKGTELLPTPDQKGIMILRLAHTPPLELDGSLTIEYDGRIW